MQQTQIYQAIITAINLIILAGLPYWFVWHFRHARKIRSHSDEWWIQILIIIGYGLAISCEIPALISRVLAYYDYNTRINNVIYILTLWDRWGRLTFYVLYMLLTWSIAKKRVPQVVKDTLS